jgi:hypothetical protein
MPALGGRCRRDGLKLALSLCSNGIHRRRRGSLGCGVAATRFAGCPPGAKAFFCLRCFGGKLCRRSAGAVPGGRRGWRRARGIGVRS